MQRRSVMTATLGLLAAPAVRAQGAWPLGRQIKVICPWPPEAANDALARLLAQRLADKLGAVAVVENRTGGAGLIGTNAVLQAAPDGYTLLASAFNTAVMPLVLKGATFDPQADLEVMARTAQAPLVAVISGTRPQRSLAEVLQKPELVEHLMRNVFFDTCVYHLPGIELLAKVIPVRNILFASEMIGAVPGIDPETGQNFDDTKRYVDALPLAAEDRALIYEGNARRAYGRLSAQLARQFAGG